MFNLYLQRNLYPNIWKVAKVKPIFKKGSPSDMANYRPVSLLDIHVPGKLLERQICINIDNHLQQCNLLSNCQWGFTKGRSTEGMLLAMTERWKTDIDHGLTVGAIFIDFKKAFDTVSHEFLSMKLQAVGISGNLHSWLMSYLTNRQQFTVV